MISELENKEKWNRMKWQKFFRGSPSIKSVEINGVSGLDVEENTQINELN